MDQLNSFRGSVEKLERLHECSRGCTCAPYEDAITRPDEGDRIGS
jgi:hypothetical protein